MQRVKLGNTGIETSYLAIGTGTNGWNGSSNQTRLGFEKCVNLLEYAYDNGVAFIDSADMYGSHRETAELGKRVGRSNLVIATKTVAKDAEKAKADIPRFLKELNADYLDIVLMHCMTRGDWPTAMRPVMDVLSDYKRRGVIRAVGVSCHDFAAFQNAAEDEWVDIVLARVNYDGVAMDAPPDQAIPVIERMKANGKAVYGMKVIGQARLADNWKGAIKFVFDLDCVDAVTIGMQSREEIDRNVDYIRSLFNPSSGSAPLNMRPNIGGLEAR